MMELQIALILLTASLVYCEATDYHDDEWLERYSKSRLSGFLMNNYVQASHPDVEPPVADGDNTTVTFDLSLQCATPVGDFVSVETWTYMSWKDSRLTWDPSMFGGVETLRISASRIWTPDIRLYNGLNAEVAEVKAVVSSSGDVFWVPPIRYLVRCIHEDDSVTHCSLKFGSWTYSGDIVDIVEPDHGDSLLANFNPACPSVVQSHEIKRRVMYYSGVSEPFVDITVDLKLAWR